MVVNTVYKLNNVNFLRPDSSLVKFDQFPEFYLAKTYS